MTVLSVSAYTDRRPWAAVRRDVGVHLSFSPSENVSTEVFPDAVTNPRSTLPPTGRGAAVCASAREGARSAAATHEIGVMDGS
jgi:hypothetical protein